MSVHERARVAKSLAVMRIVGLWLLALGVGATSLAQAPAPPAAAQDGASENQLSVWAGYGDSDNIGRTVTAEDGTYRSLGLFLGLLRQTARLDAEINSDLEYRTYTDDLFEAETIGTLDGYALVDMVEDRFAWNFAGTIDQGQQDPFAARGPANRETIKYVTTGPRLDVPFGRTSLMVSASRSANRYEESTQVDNNSDFYELTLSRQARPTTLFALGATSNETEYEDDVGAPSYRIEQLFLRVNKTMRLGTLSADLGTNEIASDAQSRRDPLLDFTWTRSLGTRSSLRFTASQGFMNTGRGGSGGTALITTNPFEQKTAGMTYGLGGERTNVTVGISGGEEDYAGGATLDNDFRSASFTIRYRATPRLNFGLRYERFDREYQDALGQPLTNDDDTAGVWLNHTLGRRFSIALDVSQYESMAIDQSVDETRTEIRFAYSPTGSTSAALGSIGR
jgi:hypothetical protein